MSLSFNMSQSMQHQQKSNMAEKQNNDLIQFIDISKGKILTLLKTVFSFLNDNSLIKNDSKSSFEKYIIDTKCIQTMLKVFHFYSANYPENGKIILHELIKERYSKFLKYYEQNINHFSNSKELQFRFYQIQALILLWLIETKFDTQYYDDLIRLVNSLITLDNGNTDNDSNSNDNIENKYIIEFLNLVIKFPFIKNNKDIIIKLLEVNECKDSIINYFNDNLNKYIQKKNAIFKKDLFDEKSDLNIGKKNITTKYKDSYFPIIKNNSFSNKRKSFNNPNNQNGFLTKITSSGFYTPEFKPNKRDSIRHFRRFTINNINNPKITISNKNEKYSRANSMSDGMNNLLIKCEEGKRKNISSNSNKNKPQEKSTKSKLRLAIQGHFYTENDFKNNIEMGEDIFTSNNKDENINDNNICENDIYNNENENESENTIVSVDELPMNMSLISNSTNKNIGMEPENIIEETKEEEEIDENEQTNDKNHNLTHKNNYVKILTDNEINDFFNQEFSDNKKKKKEQQINNNKTNKNIVENKNKIINHNKIKKRNNSNNSYNTNSNNSSRNNSFNNNLINKSKKKNIIISKEKDKNNIKNNISSNLFRNKITNKNASKENNNLSVQEKMKNYSNNVFGMLKNHKNNKKEIGLKNKFENIILQPCTKGKELMNNNINQNNIGTENNVSKERLPTDSVAKQNLLSLYNQLKTKK